MTAAAVVSEQLQQALQDLLAAAGLRPGSILVVGCSTSEVAGQKIGTASNTELAAVIWCTLADTARQNNIFVAVQCCEHLNRALVLEREACEKYGFEEVAVVPAPKAGGALASAAFEHLQHPVVVEEIRAHAGMDIGDTLIGMHLKRVAVPVRSAVKEIGGAHLTMARTRPKLIGGERACYTSKRVTTATGKTC